MRSVGCVAVLIFGICVSLRLARFNVAIGAADKPDWHGNFFVGVPAPAGALISLLPLYVELLGVPHGILTAPLTWIYTLSVGLLMVSRIPTWSGKLVGNRIKRDLVLPLFVFGVVVVSLLLSFPWLTMLVLSLVYIGSLPLSLASYQRRRRAEAASQKPADTERDAPPPTD